MLGVGPLDNRSESVQGVVCHEAQGSDPCAAPRVTGTGACSYCRTSDRRRGLEGPGLTPPPPALHGVGSGRVASEASLSLACLLEEGFPGSSRWRRCPSGRWAILCPTQWPLSLRCHSQLLERSSRGAGADSPRGWSSGDPTSSGRGCRPIEAWGDPGPPHLPISRAHPGSSMSGMWGWGRGWSPRKVAVFLCGLPSTRWAPCGLNTRLGLETQPKGRAGEGPLGCVECCCSGRRLGGGGPSGCRQPGRWSGGAV